MIDIKLIRENPSLVKENIRKKFQKDKLRLVDEMVFLDKEYREILVKEQILRKRRNDLSSEINKLKKSGKKAETKLKEAKKIPDEIKKLEDKRKELSEKIKIMLSEIPNIIHPSVPIGKDASQNVIVDIIGKPKKLSFEVKNHAELVELLGIADFDASARVAGNGFYYLIGDLALLNQAIIRYAIDFIIKKNYLFVEPPNMIRGKILNGVYSHEDIEQQAYKIEGEDLYPIATSEHPLIGMFMDRLLNEKSFPLKLCAYSMCYRKEIGSHGIDEKGLFRTHQFNKVEQVVICKPEDSYKYYDELLSNSIKLFKSLEIPVRVNESCSGDLGDLKAKGADLEAWSPRKKDYIEVCSVSNLTDAQARRLNIKFTDGKTKCYPHTLNNTVIATSRALVAILENFQQKDGSVKIPKVLWSYAGFKEISANKK